MKAHQTPRANTNHTRALHNIVSIDAWHSPPPSENGYTLHVDLTFREAKVGDDPRSKVRFKLALKHAEVEFFVPPNEKVQVIQASVAREKIVEGTFQQIETEKVGMNASAGLKAKLLPRPNLEADASTAIIYGKDRSKTTQIERPYSKISWTSRRTPQGTYAWDLSAENGSYLQGRPWDPNEEPRLRFRADLSAPIPPVMRIITRCRKEDLVVSEIQVKESSRNSNFIDRYKANKSAAAEAFIKNLLEDEGLEHGDLNEIYATLCVAEAEVMQETR